MGTLVEEIFARRVGHSVEPGEIVLLDVDSIMSHDNTTPLAIKAFREIGKPHPRPGQDRDPLRSRLPGAQPAGG